MRSTRRTTPTPVLITFGGVGLNVLLSLLLIAPLGFGGLAAVNTIATLVEMALMVWLVALGGWSADGPATLVDGAPLGAGDRGDGAAVDLAGQTAGAANGRSCSACSA